MSRLLCRTFKPRLLYLEMIVREKEREMEREALQRMAVTFSLKIMCNRDKFSYAHTDIQVISVAVG